MQRTNRKRVIPQDIGDWVALCARSPSGLRWVQDRGYNKMAGRPCGCRTSAGYYSMRFEGGTYLIHRIVYFLAYGEDPGALFLDHIDGNGFNNTPANLRLVTHAQNHVNRKSHKKATSEFIGVSWHGAAKKWQAKITVNRTSFDLGRYDDERDAAEAYNTAARAKQGRHASLNDLANHCVARPVDHCGTQGTMEDH